METAWKPLCPSSASPVSLVSQQKAGERLQPAMPSSCWGHAGTMPSPAVPALVLSRSPHPKATRPILSTWHLPLSWLQEQDPVKAVLHLPPHQGAANTGVLISYFPSKSVLNSLQEKERIQARSAACWPCNRMHLWEQSKRSHRWRGSRLNSSSNV